MPDCGWVATHEDITEQRQSEVKIEYMAHHDALTGLANRVLLNDRLDRALDRIADGKMVAVHHLDLDQFKAVNDTFGHPTGDKLLKIVAERLRGLARETDTIARMGGDEFVIVQDPIADPADATSLAQRIIGLMSEPYRHRRPSGRDRRQHRHRGRTKRWMRAPTGCCAMPTSRCTGPKATDAARSAFSSLRWTCRCRPAA